MSSTDSKAPGNIKQVNCPTCQKIVPWNDGSLYRPFCSKKCQLLDFGDWANEKNTIAVEEPFDELSFPLDSPDAGQDFL
ncbi:MAG: DNA gyrase inhibitor YacG [Pseudomonadales bacterium]|nr:DNA gyrase inhibitor YacG [Pseudomonadales bacterium]